MLSSGQAKLSLHQELQEWQWGWGGERRSLVLEHPLQQAVHVPVLCHRDPWRMAGLVVLDSKVDCPSASWLVSLVQVTPLLQACELSPPHPPIVLLGALLGTPLSWVRRRPWWMKLVFCAMRALPRILETGALVSVNCLMAFQRVSETRLTAPGALPRRRPAFLEAHWLPADGPSSCPEGPGHHPASQRGRVTLGGP